MKSSDGLGSRVQSVGHTVQGSDSTNHPDKSCQYRKGKATLLMRVMNRLVTRGQTLKLDLPGCLMFSRGGTLLQIVDYPFMKTIYRQCRYTYIYTYIHIHIMFMYHLGVGTCSIRECRRQIQVICHPSRIVPGNNIGYGRSQNKTKEAPCA